MSSSDDRQRDRQMDPLPSSHDEMMVDAPTRMSVGSCTIKDVARLAEVSTASVSRVVNGAGNVSSATKTKVLTAISRLQYSTNVHAAELGRAKGGNPRERGIHAPVSVRHEGKADFRSRDRCAK
jgi:hypothetical protein